MKKRGTFKNVKELFDARGIDYDSRTNIDSPITNLSETANFLADNVDKPFYIFGDYDVDGITSATILAKGLKWLLDKDCTMRLPKRHSEGYGIKKTAIDEFTEIGLIITVDNGIAAYDEIEYAKEKGHAVVIVDHHLPPLSGVPNADIIVDAHYYETGDFNGWCGAGLAYRLIMELAQQLGKSNEALEEELLQFAGIATIADVMELVGENRELVLRALESLNSNGAKNKGLKILLNMCGISNKVNAQTIGFSIAPIINAPGRFIDTGANMPLKLFNESDDSKLYNIADKIISINDERKDGVSKAVAQSDRYIADVVMPGEKMLFLPLDCEEGICGLVAGKLASKYKMPCIVVTKSKNAEVDLWKGSGRTYGGVNLKETLDKIAEDLFAYGGHAAAIGISVKEAKLSDVASKLMELADEFPEADKEIYYDLEISQAEIPAVFAALQKYEPFGNGNPTPVFLVKEFSLVPRTGSKSFAYQGSDMSHIKLFGNGNSAIGFNMAKKFNDMGCPTKLNLCGTMSENSFGGVTEIQIMLDDFSPSKIKRTKLADELQAFLMSDDEEEVV